MYSKLCNVKTGKTSFNRAKYTQNKFVYKSGKIKIAFLIEENKT